MNNFYRCPQCKGTNFNFVGYPDIYCRYCKSYEVVRAMPYAGIDRVLDGMEQDMKISQHVKPIPMHSKPSVPYIPKEYINGGRGVLGVGRGIESRQKQSSSISNRKVKDKPF